MIVKILAVCAVLMPLPAFAQVATPKAVAAAPVDPARLVEARKLLNEITPPEKRDKMIDDIVGPMMANLRDAMADSPDMAKVFRDKPAARQQMLDFIKAEADRSLKIAHEALPSLFEAMAVAYARQFTVEQLTDMERFFESPTGRVYVDRIPAVLSDPAITAAQRAMMEKAFDGLQDRAKAMAQKLEEEAAKGAQS
jgi:hypothetical protein